MPEAVACPHENTWFDRSICPDPCGSMHYYCEACGVRVGRCALDDIEPLFPPHMSPSSINSLLTCGEKFRLEKVERVPSRPMWAGIGGTVVHRLTEELDRDHFAALKGMEA